MEPTPIYLYTEPKETPEPGSALAQLRMLEHLIPDDHALFEAYARQAFFCDDASDLLLASIILHFQNCGYPLSSLQIVRAKTQSRELGPKGKEELKNCWYAALVAPDPSLELGFKVLVTGPAFVGNPRLARQEAFLGLRDRLEEMTHEKLRRAGFQTEKAREVEAESSGFGKGSLSGSGVGGGTVMRAREMV